MTTRWAEILAALRLYEYKVKDCEYKVKDYEYRVKDYEYRIMNYEYKVKIYFPAFRHSS